MKDDLFDPFPPNRRQFLQLGAMVTAALELDHLPLRIRPMLSGQSMIGVPFDALRIRASASSVLAAEAQVCSVGSWPRMRK